MAKLIVAGTPHELIDDLLTIGRAPDNTVVIDDASVSSHHAQLERAGGNYKLRDLGSTNGTRVNGDAAGEMTLRPGDRIRFGGVEARFESVDVKSTQPLPVAQKIEVQTAETSARPSDFVNASPFRARTSKRDNMRVILLVAAVIAALVLVAGLIATFTMRSPVP